jgi:oligopeptide/dipeptide ABC transporter ATP-binding protein
MYGGRVVEEAGVHSLFARPRHPYTAGLLASVPRADLDGELMSIPGSPPDMSDPPSGCAFHPRCPMARERCRTERPELLEVSDTADTSGASGQGEVRRSACHFADELAEARALYAVGEEPG